MATENNRPGAYKLVAFENAMRTIEALRKVVAVQRIGKDRLHLFRVAAGSAEETRTHLLVALAWGYLTSSEVEAPMKLVDKELRLLSVLTL